MSPLLRRFALVVPVVLLPLSAVASQAQGSQRDAARRAAVEATMAKGRSALAPIAAIVGDWEGEAKILAGEGAPMTIRQQEAISFGDGQTVIMIRGTGRSLDPADAGQIVFEAAAMLWKDASSDSLRMRTFHEGRSLEVVAEIRGDTLFWGFPTNGGRVRYTIVARGDTYHEIGEFMRPGMPPIKTIEMMLRRK